MAGGWKVGGRGCAKPDRKERIPAPKQNIYKEVEVFNIRKRSTGEIVEWLPQSWPTRQAAKPTRDELNRTYYRGIVPDQNREYYVCRSYRHRFGISK